MGHKLCHRHSSLLGTLYITDFFEFSWQIGAGKYSHIAVKSSLEYFPSNDTTLVSGNEEPRFLNCVKYMQLFFNIGRKFTDTSRHP